MSLSRPALAVLAVLALACALLALTRMSPPPRTATSSFHGARVSARQTEVASRLTVAERRSVLRFTRSFLARAYGHGQVIEDATPALARALLSQPQRVSPAASSRHPRVLSLTPLPPARGRAGVLVRIGADAVLRYCLRVRLATSRHGAPLVAELEGTRR